MIKKHLYENGEKINVEFKEWDSDEIYFVVDELKTVYPTLIFEPESYCSGVLILER